MISMRTWLQKLEVFVFLRKPNQKKILAQSKRWYKAISNINALIFSPTQTKIFKKKHKAELLELQKRQRLK